MFARARVHVLRRMLGESYGIPRLHYKGQQDNFYIMVRKLPSKGNALC